MSGVPGWFGRSSGGLFDGIEYTFTVGALVADTHQSSQVLCLPT